MPCQRGACSAASGFLKITSMTSAARPFRLNVGFVAHEDVGYSHRFTFELPTVRLQNDLGMEDFEGILEVGRTTQGLLLIGEFHGNTPLECARCLRRFISTLAWQFTETYAFSQKGVSESGLLLPEDGHIDLEPLLREYAVLEMPMSPLCQPDCRGLCPVCGQDLNVRDCGHRPRSGESPFSTLGDLLRS
jgi:uncharacterized protein